MQTNENTSPEFIIVSEGQVIEKSLPSPPCRTCDRKNTRNSEFIYVAELIHQKPPLSKTFHWAEALQRFCRRFKGVVAAVSVFVKFNQTANTGTAMLSSLIALCFIQDELLAIVGLKILNRHFLDDLQSKGRSPPKKNGKMWEFWKNRGGGVYPNPTSFVIWPSGFWHAKFIHRC